MIIEGRTITNVAEMLEFCLAAIARTGLEPSTIRLHVPRNICSSHFNAGRQTEALECAVHILPSQLKTSERSGKLW